MVLTRLLFQDTAQVMMHFACCFADASIVFVLLREFVFVLLRGKCPSGVVFVNDVFVLS